MKHRLFFLSLFFPFVLAAQENLTIQDAIAIALKNNYSILISKNNVEIAHNDNTAGNAGMLPSVDGIAGTSNTTNNLKQNYSDNRTVDKSGVSNSSTSAGVFLNWTLFNGMGMFATKNKLEELEAQGTIDFKRDVENLVQQVISSYYGVVQRQELLDAIKINIAIDSERVAIAQLKLDAGSGSRLDLLQARVDLNEQLSNQMRLANSWANNKDSLNYLLARQPGTPFSITDSIIIGYNASPEQLRKTVPENNYEIQSYVREKNISMYSLKELNAQRYPVIGFAGAYDYSKDKNAAGFLLLNQSTGFNYGLTLRWNLYNGSNTNRQIKNARLNLSSSGFYLEDLKLKVSAELEKALRDFQNNLQILALEQENILLARENLDVAFERFRSGLYTSLQLKDAQLSFQDAQIRLVQIQYASKLSETELMRLNGELVK
jgi:outer membrane protein